MPIKQSFGISVSTRLRFFFPPNFYFSLSFTITDRDERCPLPMILEFIFMFLLLYVDEVIQFVLC